MKLPWKIGTKEHKSGSRRKSIAIEDADGNPMVYLDPSEEEYAIACELEIAQFIVDSVNKQK